MSRETLQHEGKIILTKNVDFVTMIYCMQFYILLGIIIPHFNVVIITSSCVWFVENFKACMTRSQYKYVSIDCFVCQYTTRSHNAINPRYDRAYAYGIFA